MPVLTAALAARFASRGHADFQNKILSAMRFQFGGHAERAPPKWPPVRSDRPVARPAAGERGAGVILLS